MRTSIHFDKRGHFCSLLCVSKGRVSAVSNYGEAVVPIFGMKKRKLGCCPLLYAFSGSQEWQSLARTKASDSVEPFQKWTQASLLCDRFWSCFRNKENASKVGTEKIFFLLYPALSLCNMRGRDLAQAPCTAINPCSRTIFLRFSKENEKNTFLPESNPLGCKGLQCKLWHNQISLTPEESI